MKAKICYYSGTGNTKKIVGQYKAAFEENDVEVELVDIAKDGTPDFSDADYIGFAYPIHAFNAPKLVLKFAKKIAKQANKTNYFILKSSGEPLGLNNVSSYKLKGILKRRNFRLINEYHYVMPYNMIFRHTETMAYKMWEAAKSVIPVDAKEILNGKPAKLKYIPFGHTLAWLFRIEHWGAEFNGRFYKVNDSCVKCKLCVNKCPVGNITMDDDGKLKFGKNCQLCGRCFFFCPKDSFKIGMLNNMKVNGAYSFEKPEVEEDQKYRRFLRKSYKKYFETCEAKIGQLSEEENS